MKTIIWEYSPPPPPKKNMLGYLATQCWSNIGQNMQANIDPAGWVKYLTQHAELFCLTQLLLKNY